MVAEGDGKDYRHMLKNLEVSFKEGNGVCRYCLECEDKVEKIVGEVFKVYIKILAMESGVIKLRVEDGMVRAVGGRR